MITYPEFIENKDYLGMDSSIPEQDQLWAMLNNLTRIHLLTADKFDNFNTLIREYLVSGCGVFGLETGIVSEVTPDGKYIVRDVVSPLEVLEIGQVFPLEDTYCREVIKSQAVLGFPEVGTLDYMNCHPVYQNLKLEAYLSAPIFVGGDLFGTLNFTSTHARTNGFSRHERDLITLMANSIGNYVMLRQKEAELVDLNKRIKRFVGYVAHDLRNPIGSIIGLAQMACKPTATAERRLSIIEKILPTAQTALEFVNTILENAALSSGKLTPKLAQTDLEALLNSAQASVASLLNDSQHTVVLHKDNTTNNVTCDSERIKQALVNLLTNAAKYSPEKSDITITTERTENGLTIEIKNPIAKQSATHDNNPNVYGSTGFGLDIVKEILEAHGSALEIKKDNAYYAVVFSLPVASE